MHRPKMHQSHYVQGTNPYASLWVAFRDDIANPYVVDDLDNSLQYFTRPVT